MMNCCRTSSASDWCARKRRFCTDAPKGDGSRTQKILAALPFALTGDQTRAVAEISADLASEKRMLRLLQGDVGSGKTVVALARDGRM